ncbi:MULTISPECIES: hypothetical protein [unclassified Streptomyces]|uniref:MmyB family transcriptional regulator n=1 Tax=unclassified Streptomyces TaxID=2593676 RepID=UPI00131D9CFD
MPLGCQRRPRRLPGTAALALPATYEVIAWNDPAAALLEGFSPLPRRERDLVRCACLVPPSPATLSLGLHEFLPHQCAHGFVAA